MEVSSQFWGFGGSTNTYSLAAEPGEVVCDIIFFFLNHKGQKQVCISNNHMVKYVHGLQT